MKLLIPFVLPLAVNRPGCHCLLGPTRTLIGLIEKGSHAIGLKTPVTREMIDKYTEDIAVDSSRIQTELGFKPQYDLRSGWQETVQEMRKMGEL